MIDEDRKNNFIVVINGFRGYIGRGNGGKGKNGDIASLRVSVFYNQLTEVIEVQGDRPLKSEKHPPHCTPLVDLSILQPQARS